MQGFNPNSPQAHLLVAVLMASLLLAGLFLSLSKNASLKRRVFPFLATALGALVLAVPLAVGFPISALYTFLPLMVVAVWLNVRAFRFCDACGATQKGGALVSRAKFCSRCGAELK